MSERRHLAGLGGRRSLRAASAGTLELGARVVSNDFGMGDLTPDRTIRIETPGRTYVLYRWTITEEVKNRPVL